MLLRPLHTAVTSQHAHSENTTIPIGPCQVVAGPLYPLPCTPPLLAVQPLCVEGGWASMTTPTTMSLRVVVWTLCSGAGDEVPTPPCEVHVLTLRCHLGGVGWDVCAEGAARVQTSSLSPFAVAVDGHHGRLALATCPHSTHQEVLPSVQGWGSNTANGDVDRDDHIDPRTLQEAAQRLAQLTSDTLGAQCWAHSTPLC